MGAKTSGKKKKKRESSPPSAFNECRSEDDIITELIIQQRPNRLQAVASGVHLRGACCSTCPLLLGREWLMLGQSGRSQLRRYGAATISTSRRSLPIDWYCYWSGCLIVTRMTMCVVPNKMGAACCWGVKRAVDRSLAASAYDQQIRAKIVRVWKRCFVDKLDVEVNVACDVDGVSYSPLLSAEPCGYDTW